MGFSMKSAVDLTIGILLALSLGCLGAPKPVTLDLTRDGQPAATIVVAEKPTRAAQLAAAELQEQVRRISGATLPVVSDTTAVQGLRVLVGESAATRKLGLRSQDFAPQEYLIGFRRNTLVLLGRDKEDYGTLDYANPDGKTLPALFDAQGTCYAAYDFLERNCGVRWYLPTDLGTVYAPTGTLRVTGTERRRRPWMEFRYLLGWPDVAATTGWTRYPRDLVGTVFSGERQALDWREQKLYALRLRVAGQEVAAGGHPFYGYYPRFWKKDADHPEWFEGHHPEFFAQGYSNDPPPQMCYTSPEFVRQVVQDARDFFDGKPKNRDNYLSGAGDTFGLGAMDNASWCQCPRCNAILRKHVRPGSPQVDGEQSVSDYFFGFVNQVAREVHKTHQDKYICPMAYNAYIHPPHEPLEPNVAIVMVLGATSRRLWNPAEAETYRKALDEWVRESPARPKYVWLHWLFPVNWATYANPPWKPFPGFVAHRVVDEMKHYRDIGVRGMCVETSGANPWCQRLPLWDQLEFFVAAHLADDPDQDGNALIAEFFERYYGAAATPMRAFYELVEEVYCNPNNYPDGAVAQTPYIAWECLGTDPRMDKLGRRMDEAKAACATAVERQRVELFDKGIWQVMCAGKEQYEIVRKKATATLHSAKAPCLPAPADSDPRQLDWEQAGRLTNWSTFDGKPAERKIEGRIAHDGTTFYLRLEERLDTGHLVRDAPDVWSGDDWEIFVARRNAMSEAYRQIGIDPQGKSVDLSLNLVDQGLIREGGARIYSDTGAADCWTVFVAIPLDRLLPGTDQARPGESIYLNVVRATRGSVEGAAMWISTIAASFHTLDRLGKVALLPAGAQHENLVRNPGFEQVTPLSEAKHDWLKATREAGFGLGTAWPDAWILQVWAANRCSGEKAVVVAGKPGQEVHSGEHALLVNGGKEGISFYQHDTGKGPKGRYHCTFYARGAGTLHLGTYEYSTKPAASPAGHGVIGAFVMGPEWQRFEGVYEPSPNSDAGFCFVLGVTPNTEATVDDFELWEE
jgi:hypothetical protein